jgi:hypothetical protein
MECYFWGRVDEGQKTRQLHMHSPLAWLGCEPCNDVGLPSLCAQVLLTAQLLELLHRHFAADEHPTSA